MDEKEPNKQSAHAEDSEPTIELETRNDLMSALQSEPSDSTSSEHTIQLEPRVHLTPATTPDSFKKPEPTAKIEQTIQLEPRGDAKPANQPGPVKQPEPPVPTEQTIQLEPRGDARPASQPGPVKQPEPPVPAEQTIQLEPRMDAKPAIQPGSVKKPETPVNIEHTIEIEPKVGFKPTAQPESVRKPEPSRTEQTMKLEPTIDLGAKPQPTISPQASQKPEISSNTEQTIKLDLSGADAKPSAPAGSVKRSEPSQESEKTIKLDTPVGIGVGTTPQPAVQPGPVKKTVPSIDTEQTIKLDPKTDSHANFQPSSVKKPGSLPQPKVLLIEDEVNVAEMVRDWLSKQYHVTVAHMGRSGVQKAIEEQPDVILQDIGMPDMSGLDAIKVLREDSHTQNIPVIIVTGQKLDADKMKLISAEKNVKGIINKPFRVADFMERVGKVVSDKIALDRLNQKTSEETQKSPGDSESQSKADESGKAAAQEDKKENNAKFVKVKGQAVPAMTKRAKASQKKPGFFAQSSKFILKAACVVLLGFVLIGSAAEGTCRLVENLMGEWFFSPLLSPIDVPEVPASMTPDSVWHQNDIEYKINSLGLRDKEFANGRSANSFDILVLGGTSVFGQDMPASETVSKRLESLLRGSNLFGSQKKVIHGALWGHSLHEQLAFYENKGSALKPDLVVWVMGDTKTRAMVPGRLKAMSQWPSFVHRLSQKSRALGLMTLVYLYGLTPMQDPISGSLMNQFQSYIKNHKDAYFLILLLDKRFQLKGLKKDKNIRVFVVGDKLNNDLSWKGLGKDGHARLSKIIFSILNKNGHLLKK